MNPRFTLRIGDHLESPEKKRHYNRHVFTEIAPRYQFITRALSFGRDTAWKRRLIASLPSHEAPECVDLACGTGDLSLLLARRYPHGAITGVDITPAMLELAGRRNKPTNVRFLEQDMVRLDFAHASVDIVTGGYALRNAPDLGSAIHEIRRILKSGGTCAFLDFSRPQTKLLDRLEYVLLKVWTGFWGILLHRNHEVYGYIAESLRRFPDRVRLRRQFAESGFTLVQSRLLMFGIVEMLIFRKAASGSPTATETASQGRTTPGKAHPLSKQALLASAEASRDMPYR